ncbi:MAG: protein-methionine-sulfoxide reductase catalytic subunit MsrP [Helicobacter sp.]|nr:protein-methionine-sulfoxide reductase catalytic subunit MsrP [Helicobacteraceae bacterium]MDY3112974.1 protein-methionine-sulfoxide reductase catalytic subunit MsrP [Helicobacter sp.]
MQITPEFLFNKRREFLKLGAGSIVAASLANSALAQVMLDFKKGENIEALEITPEEIATSYNNFYEFGFSKADPKKYAHALQTKPWDIKIEGEVKKPFSIDLDELLKKVNLVERVYRFRCVEAWSMVIPWIGFELRELVELAEIKESAKYLRFTTLYNPSVFRAQGIFSSFNFPYKEVLRLDEAMHPLSILAIGAYQKPLLGQNGAPIRLIVPWKYGYKSIKSIVKIEFLKEQPISSWEEENPREYGFYGNVDPEVSHPRWSQASERVIGKRGQIKTLYLNGYAKEVEYLYAGLDRNKLY